MITRNLLLIFCAILCLGPAARAAKKSASAQSGDFQPITTHIEADPWNVLKIEKSESDRPRVQPADKKAAALNMNFLGLFSLNQYRDEQGRTRTQHSGILELPFIFFFEVNRQGDALMEGDSIDWYWFAAFDDVVQKNYDKSNARGGHATYARRAFLDCPLLFTGYKRKFDAPARVYWEALDLPLSTTISHLTDTDKETWKVLNVPLAWGYRYERDGDQASTHLLDVPFATLYNSHQAPDHASWELLAVPFFSLAAGNSKKDSHTFTLVDGPLFYLMQTSSQPGKSEKSFLRVPLLGPLCSVTRNEKGGGFHLFPGIFHHADSK